MFDYYRDVQVRRGFLYGIFLLFAVKYIVLQMKGETYARIV